MKMRILIAAALLAVGVSPLHAATITVTSTSDSGPGSLRGALANAGNGDTIDATGIAGTIVLTSGELLVSNSVTILGPGPANLAVNGNAASRVFQITNAVIAAISGLTVTNGSPPGFGLGDSGGGILNDHSTLTVSNCIISGNFAYLAGGGVYNDGEVSGCATVTIANCTLSGNSTHFSGGGIYNDQAVLTLINCILSSNSADFTDGGGIYNLATVTIANSTVNGNSANYMGGGIYNLATVMITNSTVNGNSASSEGGGIYNDGAAYGKAQVTVANSTVSSNSVNYVGGGIFNDGDVSGTATVTIANSTLGGNSATSEGGGIYNLATVMITNSTVNGNSAPNGGGIYNDGESGPATLTIVTSTLSGNSASSEGGGIYNYNGFFGTATVTIANSTLIGNSAANIGGGIYNSGTLTLLILSNDTMSDNSAGSQGGGILNTNGTLEVFACTIAGNSATSAGGLLNTGPSGSMEIGNTILAEGGSGENITNDPSSTLLSRGYNLSNDAADGDPESTGPGGILSHTGDIRNTDPMLGPLTDNGGPTLTHALLPCSPAIDQGSSLGLVTDQRGYPRTYDDPSILNAAGGDGTDIGAFEVQSHQSCTFAITAFHQIGTSKDLRLSYTTVLGSNYVVQTRSNMGSGSWTSLPGNNTGIGVVMQSIVTNGFAAPQGFYRVQQSP